MDEEEEVDHNKALDEEEDVHDYSLESTKALPKRIQTTSFDEIRIRVCVSDTFDEIRIAKAILDALKHNRIDHAAVKARAQSFRDEGRYSNSSKMVDGNMRVLRERMEVVRIKEKLERCCRGQLGWNYAPNYNYKLRRDTGLMKTVEVAGVIGGTLGFTFFSATLLLCFFSLFVNLNQIY
ncbi:hypothetical protein FNV43_RR14016 [Rhamnella rubrinervis]|uniref:Uncharacterized protein n=1 Tax=Rhamnella rubrinervis TaxID=2594499 RepID=A0A8K0H237_9ROSA|nr:hypothetical protein FNV43_RR14016 [Rhamnella rubrinervis]